MALLLLATPLLHCVVLRSRCRLAIAILLLIPLLGACGCPMPTTVKIGLVAPFEGSYRSIGYDAVYAARLAVREINATGGIDGVRLELVAYDDRGEIELAERAARNLTVDADVLVVVGHYRPETSSAAGAIYAEVGLPTVVLGGWAGGADGIWSMWPSAEVLALAMRAEAKRQGAVSAGVWGRDAIAAALLASGVPETASPFDAGLDLVYLTGPAIAGGEWLTARRAEGWEGSIVGGTDLALSSFGQIAGARTGSAVFVTPYPFPADIEGTEAWVVDYQSMGPHVSPPGPFALPTYEAIYLVADAIAEVLQGDLGLSREALAGELADVHHDGWLGEVSWDAQGYWQAVTLYLYRWTEGIPLLVAQMPAGGSSWQYP